MKWKICNRQRVYDGHFKVDRVMLQYELFSGGMSKELIREQVFRQNAVAVLPYDPKRDEIVLIEQFRVGAMEHDDNPWLIEIIAGLVEEGEDIEDVAKREAQEEANCVIEQLHHVASFFTTPGGFTEISHIYIAKTDTTDLGGICGLEKENEDIRVHVISSVKARELLDQGKLRSAIPLIAMFNFVQLRETLQQKWIS